jgi:two-component system chemotaxis sensor kinase CheA
LRSLGKDNDVAAIETAIVRAAGESNAQPMLDAITGVLQSLQQEGSATALPGAPESRREAGAGAIRVDVEKVDAIVDLTGELLVVKNALAHLTRMAADGGDAATLAASLRTQTSRLDRHVTDLQRAVLDLRVLPLGRVFTRFPLLVRETATKLGKQVAFRSEGDDTVADKAVVEALFEPLLHVVRNAIDHGIEKPDVRIAAGKPATADILMRAWREGEHVLVEVSDDGRGVDTIVVRKLAISRGVAPAEAIAALDDAEALELIFAPGFTTASAVTELSGRGVGMNAVRSAIERIGGEVSLTNMPGQGLVVRFTLPFTVMMTRVMTVEAGGQVFGLPFDAVLETIRVPRAQIRPLGGGQAFVLRDLTIPVLDLASSLELDVKQSARGDIACLVIASLGGQRVGIEIDRPGERLDLMLKPVEGLLAGMKAISGTSLLGDGRVLIVLDLGALFG